MRKLLLVVTLLLSPHSLLAENTSPPRRPAILFSCPGENRYAYVGFDYLRALQQAGFEVDYVEGATDLTWDRVKQYNVVVVLDFPAPSKELQFSQFSPNEAGRLNDYFGVLDRFRAAGGGVLLHYSPSIGGGAPNDLLKPWGIQFPLITLKDSRIVRLSNLGSGDECAFTDQVSPSPVSEGVRQIWYPIFGPHSCSWHTMPVLVDTNWQVVVRAGKTAWTEIPKQERAGVLPAPYALIPTEPIKDPVLFAIRDLGDAGRLAAIQTWHQFSIGSGMKWLYNNEILERGLAGQPSQYGQLLLNTYRWLAAPSLKTNVLGGYVTVPARLLEPQLRPGALEQLHEWFYKDAEYHRPPSPGKIFRGLIGAQTALSGGQGTVAEYAKAAAESGLDYLVILEDFTQMTPEKLARLKDAAKQASTPMLRVLTGYRLLSNTGNYMFIFGENPPWPEDRMLTGAKKDIFNLQYQNEAGKYEQGSPAVDWLLSLIGDAYKSTVGYYNFTRSGASAMQMYDLRLYSHAAIRTYEAGKLVEDMTDDYLTTWQCTLGPNPVSLNLVHSPQELRDAVASRQSLTYAQARSLDRLWTDALRWNNSYDGMNVFVSDGPIVQAWPQCLRVMTFGAEMFVTGRSLQIAPIDVTSAVGLKEIRIYDGAQLFRRIDCAGAKEFKQQLLFPGVIYQNLVLVAEDINGGRAVTYPVHDYKEGAKVPIFCGDHVNDCAGMLLAHGPHWPGFVFTPAVPDAGQTWDGGPVAMKALLTSELTWPVLETQSKIPEWTGTRPYQMPLLEFGDEGATRCRMICDRKLIAGVESLGPNPWTGYGPLEPTQLADAWASHTVFGQYTTGVDPNAYGAPGINRGSWPALFTQHLTFKTADVINRCLLFNGGWRSPNLPASVQLAVGRGGQVRDNLDLSAAPEKLQTYRLDTGDWFALYSRLPANTHLFINRGAPVVLQLPPTGDYWLKIYADFENKPVKPGDTYDTEYFCISWPMDEKFASAGSLAQVVTYLENPTGLNLIAGTRAAGPGGLLELNPQNYVVELSVPKSSMPVTLPVRVNGFNKRWSVGLYQLDGYRTHYYSKANSGYRALGLDFDGRAYVPLYVNLATNTHVRLGHPIIADKAGQDLFIQVTKLSDNPDQWHVSVNNPTDAPITTKLSCAMELPGLKLAEQTLTLNPGEYRVLE